MASETSSVSFGQCLAQELTDMIIDFLHDDKYSLRACSLVCTAWTREAQYHLFHTRRIEARNDQGGYLEQLYRPCQEPLHSQIRELALSAGPIPVLSPELTEDTITTVMNTLPRLRFLKLRQTGYVGSISEDHPYKLCSLSVSWMYPSIPGTCTSLVSLLSLFHTIRVLDLEVIHRKHLYTEEMLAAEETRLSKLVRVHALQLHDVSALLLRTLQRSICPEYLQTVRFPITTAEDTTHIGAFLRDMGQNIQHFQLSIWNFWCNDRTDWNALGLENCPSLRSVVILYANSGPFYSWETVFEILRVVPPSVTDVTLVVREAGCLKTVDWNMMRSELKRFGSLRKLRFALCTGDTFRSRALKPNVQQLVWKGLPELKAKGILW